jgi:hypothetical protein
MASDKHGRNRLLAVITALLVASGLMTVVAPAASAARCPTVDRVTGAVRPAPTAGVDWSGCNLKGANLRGAHLRGAYLRGANLTRANLRRANLTRADLSGTDLTRARFTDATLTGVKSGVTTGTPAALPSGWQKVKGLV